MPKTVAILGRPNVGKSTLFNRLAGKKLALVHDTPGVTRDWKIAPVKLGSLSFDLIDTAGLEEGGDKSLTRRMKESTEQVLRKKADLALLVIDARDGITPVDKQIASWIRPAKIPVIVVANKCEGAGGDAGYYEAFSLGFDEPVAISAEHGEGVGELITRLAEELKGKGKAPEELSTDSGPLHLAIVGRPNAGKSTLINRLVGEERMLTGPEAGITRDSIALDWEWAGRKVQLFDTAGLRRRAKVRKRLEQLSVDDTLKAIDFAEVVVLILEPEEGLSHQDLKIATQVLEEGRGLVLAVNKIDQLTDIKTYCASFKETVREKIPHAKGVLVIFISALKGIGIDSLMPAVFKVHKTWNRRIPTAQLNEWLRDILSAHPLPMVAGRHVKIRYISQIKTRPPTFALFANRPKAVPESYLRYLENNLRKSFNIAGVPIRFLVRGSKNPYAVKKSR